MRHLENNLYGLFSAESGLEEELISEILERKKASRNSPANVALRKDMLSAFNDPDFDWISFLNSPGAFVADVASNEEGKKYVIDILWNPLFPNEDPNTAV